ncbi:hypothetical protein [Chitinophaga arvensicola]|uniref:Uncharacterized protein n=1 Tax=Chitinophaga arvensicola TaxID=29529 RepID=A0A1I0NQ64_9BACT|nr:hypothetical protein [Chitinophaga arvensicola]SEW03706.1 hypothetical protein SAMN04488122_0314 [Chitinophaga arvensicola]
MDNQISDIENYIAASGMRTARRRKRDARKQYDKQLLQLDRERNELWDAWYKRGYVVMDPPVMIGYKRYFVLRDDVARGKHGAFFQELLNKINTYDYSHRKDFKVKKRSHGRKKYVLREQHLLQPSADHLKKLKLTDKEINCFVERIRYVKNSIQPIKEFVVKEPWRFVLQIRPNMITRKRIVLPEVSSAIDQLQNYLDRNQLQHRISWLTRSKSAGRRRWELADKKKDQIKKYTLLQILQEEWYE